MRYELWWNGEKIDEAETLREAEYLRDEYWLAFGGEHAVIIKRVRT